MFMNVNENHTPDSHFFMFTTFMNTYIQPHLYGSFQFITQDLKSAYGVANNTAIQKLQYSPVLSKKLSTVSAFLKEM